MIALLARCRRELGKEDPETLTMLNDLGLLYQDQGKYKAAEECLEGRRKI